MSAIPMTQRATTKPHDAASEREKAVKILAKTLYRDLRAQGFDPRHVVCLATELIAQVTGDKSEPR